MVEAIGKKSAVTLTQSDDVAGVRPIVRFFQFVAEYPRVALLEAFA
jgi:hypothetical protein